MVSLREIADVAAVPGSGRPAFLLASSARFGYGHLARCLKIAGALVRRASVTAYVVSPLPDFETGLDDPHVRRVALPSFALRSTASPRRWPIADVVSTLPGVPADAPEGPPGPAARRAGPTAAARRGPARSLPVLSRGGLLPGRPGHVARDVAGRADVLGLSRRRLPPVRSEGANAPADAPRAARRPHARLRRGARARTGSATAPIPPGARDPPALRRLCLPATRADPSPRAAHPRDVRERRRRRAGHRPHVRGLQDPRRATARLHARRRDGGPVSRWPVLEARSPPRRATPGSGSFASCPSWGPTWLGTLSSSGEVGTTP